jgi:23S rRNA pseudouridine955/2504/2580 synthase
MSDAIETILIQRDEAGMRFDRWFRTHFPDVTHGYLQKLLRSGQVASTPSACRPTRGWKPASRCACRTSCASRRGPSRRCSPARPLQGRPRLIERMILFEDEHVLVLNKPFGIAVQGGTGTKRHIDGILAGMADRFGDRPRLVHRLDRDTTGVLLVAKHRDAAAKLGRIFQTRSAAKTYWALVKGRAEAAAGQGGGRAGKSPGARRRGPRAQGAAGRAGQGHACHHALLGDRPRRAQGILAVAEAGHRPAASIARAHGPDRPSDHRRQQVRG